MGGARHLPLVRQLPVLPIFSNGNENLGDFDLPERITTAVKVADLRQLYTVTSNFGHPLLPCEDYLCAFEAALCTEGLGGFEPPGLTDYTGLNTVTVGLLDALGRSNGIVNPAQFRRFAKPAVPQPKGKDTGRSSSARP